ncbi:concanavalin A-like lectin/glucanase domain-containing protein [Scheffersomyces amazonensis]|uniref:concanavalin A-like lectin/glucanase domain-containing protein n=1 Tax=Scheffersomyces amazonensis TaxID=1078765 RepID=UPI00315DE9B5
MGFVGSIRRSRTLQFILILIIVGGVYWFYPFSETDDESYTPEELNSILQNKDNELNLLKKVELEAKRLKSPFLDTGSYRMNHWNLKGNTMIKNSDYIRLTSDKPHQLGSIFAKEPIPAESFEMELTFRIHSQNSIGLIADGLAIWLLDEPSDLGDVFGAKNYFNGLGVMIDTFRNGKRGNFPFVNIMLGDGKTKYAKEDDGYGTRLAGCNTRYMVNPPSGSIKMRLIYIKNGYLSIDFNYDGVPEAWSNCVTLTDVQLPPVKYLGLSAETGQLTENVDIIENRMYALYKPDGKFVESIEELTNLLNDQHNIDEEIKSLQEDVKKEAEVQTKAGSKRPNIKQKRRSIQRLRNAEKRIKERERKLRLEKYGDEDATFVKRSVGVLLTSLKFGVYFIIAVLIAWCAFIIYRIQKQKKKSKVTGLLD